ncbi:MAG: TIGR03620 family F420-dependent LLM class oxidoreductase [Mycobacterium sp.]
MYEQFGAFGAWLNPALGDRARIDYAPELEELGFSTIWLGIGAKPVGDLALLEGVLAATRTATVATAIINMWQDSAQSVAAQYHRLADRFGARLLLGVGLGHPESTQPYRQPYTHMVGYLDTLLSSGVPAEKIVVAALGTKTLDLAGTRTLGAHPYNTTPEHTRFARDVLGPTPLLAVEHKVVLTEDVEYARSIGRPAIENPYLRLRNYTSNLVRHGFTEQDIAGSGSDRLIDALVLHGPPAQIFDQLAEHLTAGANHVGIQVLTEEHGASPMTEYRALAQCLPSRASR